MANKNWPKIIRGLKRLVRDNGPVWPEPSTKLAGYAEDGPYRCGNCEYLLGIDKGEIFKDEGGLGRCKQIVMIADSDVKKDSKGRPIVDIENGCCEFVEPPKKESNA